MGDPVPTGAARALGQEEDIIAVDPDYQSSITNEVSEKKRPAGFFERFKKQRGEAGEKSDNGEEEKKKDGEEKKEDPGMGNYIRIMKYGTGLDLSLQAVGSIAAIAAGVTFPFMTLVFGELVTDFTEFFMPNSTISPAEFRHNVDSMCLYFVYLFLGKFLLGYIAIACFRLSGTRISAAIRLDYLTSIFRQDLAYFDALATSCVQETSVDIGGIQQDPGPTSNASAGTPGAVAVSITALSNTVQLGISEKLAMFIQFVAMLIGGFAIAFSQEWRLTLVTTCILPATVMVYGISIPIEIKLEKRVLAAQAKAAELAEEVLGSVRTVKSFNAEKRLLARYEDLLEKGRKEGMKKAPNTGVQFAGAFTVIYCGYSLCFWYGLRLFKSGEITEVGTIITVFFAVLIAVMSFGNIAPQAQAMAKAASASSTIFEVVDRQPTIDATSPDGLKPQTLPPGDLELKNVKFSYPGGGERENIVILGPARDGGDDADSEGISLAFPEGQTTAIVGRSGSGKSTIVGLIERWYDPQHGSISIGGVDIRDLNLRWWRGKIGLVMQEPFLFNDSIYKNVAYGLMGSEWEDEPEEEKRRMVREACIEANASAFVDELPEGYNTKVGESGVKLSGGQKQRIAIARSIISKPPILILDEATSAIDPRNERIVQDALDRVSKGRTTITIAHRLSTVKKADRIVVLGNGNVLEVGTHEELLARPDGAYTKLVNGQTLVMDGEQVVLEDEEDVLELEEEGVADTTEALKRTATWRSKISIGRGKGSVIVDDVEAAHLGKAKELGVINCISLMLWEQRKLWPFYLVGVFGSVGAGAAFPVQSILFARFLEVFQYSYDINEFVRRGNFWALMFFVLALAVGLFYFLMGSTFTLIQYRLTTHYRLEYFQNVLRQGIPFFDKEGHSTGSLTSQLNTDPTALQNLLGTNTGMITVSFVNVLGCSILALIIGWKLALVCICGALPFIFFAGLVRIRIELKFATNTAAVFAESAQFASEAVGAYRTVSSLIMEQSVRERYRKLLADHVKQSFRATIFAAMVFSASESINLLAGALCFWYGGRLMSTREYEPYHFFVVYMAIIQGGEAAGHFFGFTPDIAQAVQAANRILSMREESPPPPGEVMDRSEKGGYEVEFRNVDFKYSTRDTPVFRNLSLKIEKGQFAAFVGASGCGKTTTISLLERFYSVTGGEILVDGKNLDSLDIESYRDVVSLVAQEPTLYQGTVSENVRLGAKDENISHDEVIQACKEAHIHDFITSLPSGYETICGARGVGLSGGQKQRVAIARALIRKPGILLLDEATASLDSESEKIVQQAFENAAQGRTMIAVAHRLSTIQKADVIFVFDEGKVVEQGTHTMLIKKKGVYFQMCQAQALDH